MQIVLVVNRPWVRWFVVAGVLIGAIVALNTAFNPKATHEFTVTAVKVGIGFWIFLGAVIKLTQGVEFRVADKAPE